MNADTTSSEGSLRRPRCPTGRTLGNVAKNRTEDKAPDKNVTLRSTLKQQKSAAPVTPEYSSSPRSTKNRLSLPALSLLKSDIMSI
jgi:hypothetical protein